MYPDQLTVYFSVSCHWLLHEIRFVNKEISFQYHYLHAIAKLIYAERYHIVINFGGKKVWQKPTHLKIDGKNFGEWGFV